MRARIVYLVLICCIVVALYLGPRRSPAVRETVLPW
jgi:hypothetical protein